MAGLMKRSLRRRWLLSVILLLLLVGIVTGLMVGAAPLSLGEVWSGLFGGRPSALLIWEFRVPRLLLALLVGAALAVSGTGLQALFRNPLADPFILGVASGGALGAAGALFLGVPSFLIPFLAFLSSLLTAWVVYRLGLVNGILRTDTLLLAGVAMNAFLSSLLTLLLYLNMHRILASAVYFWLLGGFQAATWREVRWVVPYVVFSIIVSLYHSRPLNALLFGEEWAHYTGVETERVKRWLLVAVALGSGAAVAAAGIIGFVGLIAPHLVRLLIGPDHRFVIPAAAFFGASLLLWCDIAARSLMTPSELPVGIFTAFVGVPFFLFLLRTKKGLFV